MRRDLDLIIKMLEHLEQRNESSVIQLMPIEGYSKPEIQYHQILMADAELIFCETSNSSSTRSRIIMAWPFDLTWKGQEFLALYRDKRVWNEIKAHFGQNLKRAPIETLFDVAKTVGKQVAISKIENLIGE